MRFFAVCCWFLSLYAKEQIDLISYCPLLLPEEQVLQYLPHLGSIDSFPLKYERIRETYQFSAFHYSDAYIRDFTNDPNLRKIIYYDYCKYENISKLPKEKLVLFKWEAEKIDPQLYERYSTVYTIDDDWVDGVKFFKFYYPALLPMIDQRTSFEEKKLCVMVAANWIEERLQILEFFSSKPLGEFEYYGTIEFPHCLHPAYQGTIPGYHSGIRKIRVLDQYRFCICFENTHTTRGYITEKIFNCFAAGCVPIYWGPDNVEDYIPKECFIDYRSFKGHEEMYQCIKRISKSTYEQYIENIQAFLQSPKAHLFSPDHFDEILLESVLKEIF
jgi:hypothetical protein